MGKNKSVLFFFVSTMGLLSAACSQTKSLGSGASTNSNVSLDSTSCGTETMTCSDQSVVGRDPSNNCNFYACANVPTVSSSVLNANTYLHPTSGSVWATLSCKFQNPAISTLITGNRGSLDVRIELQPSATDPTQADIVTGDAFCDKSKLQAFGTKGTGKTATSCGYGQSAATLINGMANDGIPAVTGTFLPLNSTGPEIEVDVIQPIAGVNLSVLKITGNVNVSGSDPVVIRKTLTANSKGAPLTYAYYNSYCTITPDP